MYGWCSWFVVTLVWHCFPVSAAYYTVYQRSWWDACSRCRTLRADDNQCNRVHGSVIISYRYCDYSTGYQYESVSISRLPSWYSSVWPVTRLFIWPTTASSPLMPVLADTAKCVVRRTYNNFGDRCFAAAGPHLWNMLPLNLRLCDSLGQFKRSLKTFLFGLWDHGALWH